MTVDEDLLAEAETAAARVADLETQLEVAKAEYRQVIRRMHLAGASMREIAEAVGISHQRVHQIIEDGAGPRRWRRRRRDGTDLGRITCSFCGREQRQVRRLVAGPGVYICDPCIAAAIDISTPSPSPQRHRSRKDAPLYTLAADSNLVCSFCAKPRSTLQALVAAHSTKNRKPPVTICDECLGLCQEIVDKQLQ